jgi:hypothetical protein
MPPVRAAGPEGRRLPAVPESRCRREKKLERKHHGWAILADLHLQGTPVT